MRESDLIAFGVRWLHDRNLAPLLEVQLDCSGRSRAVDLIGFDHRRIVAIEAKKSLTKKAIEQAASCDGASEKFVLCFTATAQAVELAAEQGIGILMPHAGSCREEWPCVIQLADPARANIWRDTLSRAPTKSTAGVPQVRGVSSLADESEAIAAYLAENGATSWRVLYRRVDNSAASWTAFRQRHAATHGWKPERKPAEQAANY